MARRQALGIGSFANPFAVKQKPKTGIAGMSMQPIDARAAAGMNAQGIMANYGYIRDAATGNVGLPEIVDTRGTGRYWTGDHYETPRGNPSGGGMDMSIEGGFPGFAVSPTRPPVPASGPAPAPAPGPAPQVPPVAAPNPPYSSQYLYNVRTGTGSNVVQGQAPAVQPGFQQVVTPNTSRRYR